MSRIRPPRFARSVAVTAAVASTVCALTGCVGLPEHTGVERGLEVGARVLPPLRFQFPPPQAGASPEEIVRGFMVASSQPDEDDRAALAYMTYGAWQGWMPRNRVTVYASPDQLTIKPAGPSAVEVAVAATAEVAVDGRYTELPRGTIRRKRIQLTRESGEWRIAALPEGFGRWVQKLYFDAAYRPFQVSYLAAREQVLMRDYRWFPFNSAITTTLARAQLEPVPDYLKGVANSGFPAGTRLEVDAVRVEDRTAIVELSARAQDASALERRGMWAQLLNTLKQAPGVARVSLQIGTRRLDVVGLSEPPVGLGDLGYVAESERVAERLVLRRGDALTVAGLATLTGAGAVGRPIRPVAASLPKVPKGWPRLAASADLRHFSAVARAGRSLAWWTDPAAAPVVVPIAAVRLSAPTFDEQGAWVAGTDPHRRTRVWFLSRYGASVPKPALVSAKWLDRRTVVSMRATPSGRRVATLSVGPGGARVGVSGVQRLPSGAPTVLNAPLTVAAGLVDVTDVTWVDEQTLAVIGRRGPKEPARPWLAYLNGSVRPLPQVAQPSSVDCIDAQRGDGQRGVVVVRTTKGAVLVLTGKRWRQVGTASDVVMAGG